MTLPDNEVRHAVGQNHDRSQFLCCYCIHKDIIAHTRTADREALREKVMKLEKYTAADPFKSTGGHILITDAVRLSEVLLLLSDKE